MTGSAAALVCYVTTLLMPRGWNESTSPQAFAKKGFAHLLSMLHRSVTSSSRVIILPESFFSPYWEYPSAFCRLLYCRRCTSRDKMLPMHARRQAVASSYPGHDSVTSRRVDASLPPHWSWMSATSSSLKQRRQSLRTPCWNTYTAHENVSGSESLWIRAGQTARGPQGREE